MSQNHLNSKFRETYFAIEYEFIVRKLSNTVKPTLSADLLDTMTLTGIPCLHMVNIRCTNQLNCFCADAMDTHA